LVAAARFRRWRSRRRCCSSAASPLLRRHIAGKGVAEHVSVAGDTGAAGIVLYEPNMIIDFHHHFVPAS